MVQKKGRFVGLRNIASFNAYQDLRRSRARGSTQFNKELCEYRKLLEGDNDMDESFKNFLFCLFSGDEISEPHNKQNDKDNDDVSEEGDYDDCSSDETEPQYRLFLQHLKPDGKSYVLEYEKDGVPVVRKYEGDTCSDDECEFDPESYTEELDGAAEHGKQCGSVKKNDSRNELRNEVAEDELEDDECVSTHKCKTVINGKIGGVTGKKRGRPRKSSRATGRKVGGELDSAAEHGKRCGSVKTTDILSRGELRNKVDEVELEDDDCLDMRKGKTVISRVKDQKKQDHTKLTRATNQMPRVENQRKRGQRPNSVRTGRGSTMRKSRNVCENLDIMKCSYSDFVNAKAARNFMPHKNIYEHNLKKEGEDEFVPDVEILGSTAAYPFVPSNNFAKTIEEDDFQHIGRLSESNEFRKQVLSVLRKPYDKEEYTRLGDALRDGRYLDYHPDLGKKLQKYRDKRAKRLTIIRGFFFWLQNLSHEGAFEPWKDRECLAVEPGSPVKPSTSK